MYPLLKNNNRIFCIKPFFLNLSEGDIIVFNHLKYGLMIKKITNINEQGFYVKGTLADSIDSSILGYIQRSDILYKMLLKF